jgi:hypothetical protein
MIHSVNDDSVIQTEELTAMLHEIADSRINELRAAETRINNRIAWENISRIERLECALKSARGRLQSITNITARA